MSTATKPFVIQNGTPLDASQVEQDLVALLGFINGSVPHSDGTGGGADLRALRFIKSADNGKMVLAGTTSVSVSAGNRYFTATQAFGVTFGTVPKVTVGVKQGNAGSLTAVAGVQSATTTQVILYIRSGDSSNFGGAATYDIDWIAVG